MDDSPSRAARRDPIETSGSIITLMRIRSETSNSKMNFLRAAETIGPPCFEASPDRSQKNAPEPDNRSCKFDANAIAAICR